MDADRKTAFQVLLKMERTGAYSNIELNKRIGQNPVEKEGFVREMVYSTVKNRYYLDYLLRQLVTRGYDRLPAETAVLLRLGACQIIFLSSVPPYAAVSETVTLAKRYARHQAGMVNGVLRNLIRKKDQLRRPEKEKDPIRRLSATYSYSPWIVRKWIDMFGQERTEAILKAENVTPELTLRINELKTSREELRIRLEKEGFSCKDDRECGSILYVRGSRLLSGEAFKAGMFFIQDKSSVMAVSASGAAPGDTVIDTCAAPGGKSFSMAVQMKNKGTIVSFDRYENKLSLISREKKRLEIGIISEEVHDGRETAPEWIGKADVVLCDAPCSGLGVIRRKPEIKYRALPDGGKDLAELQLAILTASAAYLKPEGTLVYSTCTINDIENEKTVRTFLAANDAFHIEEERQFLPDQDMCDGFYYCVMKMQAEKQN